MGRFYKTGQVNTLDFMSRLPEGMLLRAAQQADQTITANKAATMSLYDQLQANALSPDEDRLRTLLDSYEESIDNLSRTIQENPLEYRRQNPKVADLARGIHRDFTRGEIAAIQGNYNTFIDWDKRHKEALKKGDITQRQYETMKSFFLQGFSEQGGTGYDVEGEIGNRIFVEDVTKFQDIPKIVDDFLREAKASSTLTKHPTIEGKWLMHTEQGQKILTEQELATMAFNHLMGKDEVLDFVRQGQQYGYVNGKLYDDDPESETYGQMISPIQMKTRKVQVPTGQVDEADNPITREVEEEYMEYNQDSVFSPAIMSGSQKYSFFENTLKQDLKADPFQLAQYKGDIQLRNTLSGINARKKADLEKLAAKYKYDTALQDRERQLEEGDQISGLISYSPSMTTKPKYTLNELIFKPEELQLDIENNQRIIEEINNSTVLNDNQKADKIKQYQREIEIKQSKIEEYQNAKGNFVQAALEEGYDNIEIAVALGEPGGENMFHQQKYEKALVIAQSRENFKNFQPWQQDQLVADIMSNMPTSAPVSNRLKDFYNDWQTSEAAKQNQSVPMFSISSEDSAKLKSLFNIDNIFLSNGTSMNNALEGVDSNFATRLINKGLDNTNAGINLPTEDIAGKEDNKLQQARKNIRKGNYEFTDIFLDPVHGKSGWVILKTTDKKGNVVELPYQFDEKDIGNLNQILFRHATDLPPGDEKRQLIEKSINPIANNYAKTLSDLKRDSQYNTRHRLGVVGTQFQVELEIDPNTNTDIYKVIYPNYIDKNGKYVPFISKDGYEFSEEEENINTYYSIDDAVSDMINFDMIINEQ